MPPRPTGPGPLKARTLAVDETMVWPRPPGTTLDALQSSASGSLTVLRPKRFTTRQVVEGGQKVLRVTRTR